jgi:CRP-like cAMP-binding protein
VERVGAGSLIGVSAGFMDRKYVSTARALSDTETIYISRQQLIRSLQNHPKMRMLILASLGRSVQQAMRCFLATHSRANEKAPQSHRHLK